MQYFYSNIDYKKQLMILDFNTHVIYNLKDLKNKLYRKTLLLEFN